MKLGFVQEENFTFQNVDNLLAIHINPFSYPWRKKARHDCLERGHCIAVALLHHPTYHWSVRRLFHQQWTDILPAILSSKYPPCPAAGSIGDMSKLVVGTHRPDSTYTFFFSTHWGLSGSGHLADRFTYLFPGSIKGIRSS
ncbi:hypothetical protein MD484_g8765, partial [Candolleomyces efflorescens]